MTLWHAPSGKLVRGHVLDVNVTGFTRALQELEPRLYVTWNPKKMKGWGCWEIRIQPTKKTAVYKGTYEGTAIYSLEYRESRDIHHVLDCAFLNYDAIRKLKTMDTYNKQHWIHRIDQAEAEQEAERLEHAKKEMKYAIKQNRSAARDLYEMVRSGVNPGRIITSTKWEV